MDRPEFFKALCLIGVFFCAGCATIAHGSTQYVSVVSEPAGATVFVSHIRAGVTPFGMTLSRRHDYVLRFEKTGFTTREIALNRKASAWLIADVGIAANPLAAQGLDDPSKWPLLILEGLALFIGVDTLTGGAFKLPPTVRATLEPSQEDSPLCGAMCVGFRR